MKHRIYNFPLSVEEKQIHTSSQKYHDSPASQEPGPSGGRVSMVGNWQVHRHGGEGPVSLCGAGG